MRRVVLRAQRELSLEEVPIPEPTPGEALLRTVAVGICGSDIHGYTGLNSRRLPGVVMGHEAIGSIDELNSDSGELVKGQLVAVNPVVGCGRCEWCLAGQENLCQTRALYGCVPQLPGAFADKFTVRQANLVPLKGPEAATFGALTEPFAVGIHAVGRIRESLAGRVLVIGGGAIGIATALAAQLAGLDVTLSEPNEARRDVSLALGLNAVRPTELPADAPYGLAFECVGNPETFSAALGSIRPRGEVVFVGAAAEIVPLPVMNLVTGERTISGSTTYTSGEFRQAADWICSGDLDLTPMIELRIPLDEVPAVFRRYADGSLTATKTIVDVA